MITRVSDELPFSLYISGTSYGYKKTDGTFVAFRGDSTATYTYATNSTGGTVDMGARNNYRYVNAQNVYTKGKADGVTTHTGTYTFASGSTGSTVDLGTTHTYRYVNATNVYNKGKADGASGGFKIPSGKFFATNNNNPSYYDISTYSTSTSRFNLGYQNIIVNCDTITKVNLHDVTGNSASAQYGNIKYLNSAGNISSGPMFYTGYGAGQTNNIPSDAVYIFLGVGSTNPSYASDAYFI